MFQVSDMAAAPGAPPPPPVGGEGLDADDVQDYDWPVIWILGAPGPVEDVLEVMRSHASPCIM